MEGFLGEGNSEETEFIISKTFIRAFSLEEAIALEQETIAEIRQKFMNRSSIIEAGLAKGMAKPLSGEVAGVVYNIGTPQVDVVHTGFYSFPYQNTSNNTWYDCKVKTRASITELVNPMGGGVTLTISISKDGQILPGIGQYIYIISPGTYTVTSLPFDMEPNCIYKAHAYITACPTTSEVIGVKGYITDINLE